MIGRPVAVQRRLEYTLAPGLEWTIQCYLDLETLRPADGGEPVSAIVDYKVKTTLHTQAKADQDPRPACTSQGAGSRATPPMSSRSPRSASPDRGASRSVQA